MQLPFGMNGNSALFLVRDRIGEKPLYYSKQGNEIYFGSEIKAILKAIDSYSVNYQAICDYLAIGYVPSPKTFFKEINKLQPGGMLISDANGIEIRRYWNLNIDSNGCEDNFETAILRLNEKLNEAVGLCLKSDVEVGAFLSGGIDSSAIVSIMRKNNVKVQTFSVGYEGEAEGFNELKYAKEVANFLKTNHHELILGAKSSIDLVPKLIWHYDEPHGEPTSALVYLLCQFTSKWVKVAMGGTGGDEIFYGYPKHTGLRLFNYYRMIPKLLRKYLIERIIVKWPESTKGKHFAKRAKRFISGAEFKPEEAYLTWVSLFQKDLRHNLLSKTTIENATDPMGDSYLRHYLLNSNNLSLFECVTALDINGYLPEYQLSYMDRMSMAHGLEVRAPLCDYKLIEYVTALPTSFRLKGTRSKHIFKEVSKKWLPNHIVERKKVGFDSPIGLWFKTELLGFLESFLSKNEIKKSGILNPDAVELLIGDHLSGKMDYSLQIWSLVALEVWYRMYIEGKNKGTKKPIDI